MTGLDSNQRPRISGDLPSRPALPHTVLYPLSYPHCQYAAGRRELTVHTGFMADTYRGPATVLMNGTEHPAEADLAISVERSHFIGGKPYDTLVSWDGTLTADPGIDWFKGEQPERLTLRMPDQQIGTFVVAGGYLGSGQVEISGIGPAPFGD